MSVQSEINRLSGNVSDTLEAISEKGVTVPAGAKSDNMADLVRSIFVAEPATETPLMDGTAAVGSSIKYAREDHIHPVDTSRAAASSLIALSSRMSAAESALGSGGSVDSRIAAAIEGLDSSISSEANKAIASFTIVNGKIDSSTKIAVPSKVSQLTNDSGYQTASDVSTAIASGIANKVDKVSGKGLSTNDYTTTEKNKLAAIASGAEVNVQADWSVSDSSSDAFIKNKPTLGTAAAKNATDTYSATGTDVVTGKAVASALATLPAPMVFKGSLGTNGTITTLPTASSSNTGHTYKVITAGTYASQAAKVGDTFISDGTAWVLIPSGDEPSGTVTNVAIANATNGGLTISGSPITSSGTFTVGHTNIITAGTAKGDDSKTLTFGGTFTIPSVTYDSNGHITSKGTTTMTMPSDANYAKKDGSNASGTWGISISGNAASASKLTSTSAIGGSTQPVYFTASGVPSAISYTIAKSVPSDAKFTDTTYTAASATPLMDGTAAVGTSSKYAREDHRHPTDTNVLSLTGGNVTGPVSFGDAVSIDSLTAGNVVVTGKISATNGVQADVVTASSFVGTLTGNASTASIATKVGDGTIYMVPGLNNEINFGGSNTSDTVYMGYRATDSKSIPAKFVFGGSSGSANLQANTVYLGSGTTSYISSTQYTGNAATASSVAWANVSGHDAGVDADLGINTSSGDTTKFLNAKGGWAVPTNTTYTFANGTNGFTVTPAGGSAQTVTVTPSIANNITGSGTSGYIAKFNGANTITNGPAFGSSTTSYLRNDGSWATPTDTNNAVTQTATTTNAAYEVLFSVTADNTTRTEGARKNSNLTFNPSTGILSAVGYTLLVGTTAKAQMVYDSSVDTINFVFV